MLLSVPPTTNQDFAKVKATSLCCTKFIHSTFQSQSHSQRHVDSTYRVTVKDRVIWLHRGRWWATIQLRSCRIDRNPEIIVSKVKAAALENATHKSVYKFVLERCILFFVCASNRNMWECAHAWQIDWRIHIKTESWIHAVVLQPLQKLIHGTRTRHPHVHPQRESYCYRVLVVKHCLLQA